MKKSGLVALLSASLLLVSCGGTSYVNEKTNNGNVERDTLTLYSETFKLESYAKGSVEEGLITGAYEYETYTRYEGKLESTDTENKYKLTYETVATKVKVEGDGAFTYTKVNSYFYTALGYTEEEIDQIFENKEVKKEIELTSHVTVNPENKTFALL